MCRSDRRASRALSEGTISDRVTARLIARHEPGAKREGHRRRAPQIGEQLNEADSADLAVEVGDETSAQVAARVRDATRWTDRIHPAVPFALSTAECQ